jgi:hypothetical protein
MSNLKRGLEASFFLSYSEYTVALPVCACDMINTMGMAFFNLGHERISLMGIRDLLCMVLRIIEFRLLYNSINQWHDKWSRGIVDFWCL